MRATMVMRAMPTRHTLTGVWVEILLLQMTISSCRHTLTGVWVEICRQLPYTRTFHLSHPHGCVSWNCNVRLFNTFGVVTPSRVCELKYPRRKLLPQLSGHTLTGVWVEIHYHNEPQKFGDQVTPSRVCELKYFVWQGKIYSLTGHTLTGVWVEMIWSI